MQSKTDKKARVLPPSILSFEERKKIECYLEENLSLNNISHCLYRSPATIQKEIKLNGGIRAYNAEKAQAASNERIKSRVSTLKKRLTLQDRIKIEYELKNLKPFTWIAKEIGISSDSVRKEIMKNGGRENYNAKEAQESSNKRKSNCGNHMKIYSNQRNQVESEIESLKMHIEILSDIIKELRDAKNN